MSGSKGWIPKGESVWELYNGQIKNLRNRGLSLEAIGNKFNVTRERVRQILVEHYGNTIIPELISRGKLAKIIGCSTYLIRTLEKEGLVNPIVSGNKHLYSREEVERTALTVSLRLYRRPDVERICETCGKKFYVRSYQIRPSSPRRFCSKRCHGVWASKTYGLGARSRIGDDEN